MIETKFKETEVGRVPADWEVKTLGEMSKICTGKRNGEEQTKFGKYPFFVRSETVYKIDSYSHDGEAIIVPGEGGIGRIFHYINGKFDYHQRVYKISDFPQDICVKFVYYYMRSFFGTWAMENSVKATVDSLRLPTFENFSLAMPSSLSEQRRIATALSDIDSLISSLDELIEKKRNIKQGTMQQLLTGKTRLKGFSEPWGEKCIDDICNRRDNLRIPVSESERKQGTTPYYGANGIQDYVDGFTHDGENILLAEDGANSLTNYPIRYVFGKIWVNNHAHVLQAKEVKADNKFLSYAFRIIDFESSIVGCGRSKLNSQTLMQLKVTIPSSLSEQRAIASILTSMDDEIAALEHKREKYVSLKQGMMQELLTGRIRLV